MRLEINIPDNTREDLKARLIDITERLSARPELAEEIELDEDAAIQRMFTPDRLAHIARADAEIDAGNFFTAEQVDEHFKQKHSAWIQTHQH